MRVHFPDSSSHFKYAPRKLLLSGSARGNEGVMLDTDEVDCVDSRGEKFGMNARAAEPWQTRRQSRSGLLGVWHRAHTTGG